VTGGWKTLDNEELRNLYPSPSIIRVIKSRTMRSAGHVACMGDVRKLHTKFLSENLKRIEPSEDPCVHGRIIVEGMLGK